MKPILIREKTTGEIIDLDPSLLNVKSLYYEVMNRYDFLDPAQKEIIKKKFFTRETAKFRKRTKPQLERQVKQQILMRSRAARKGSNAQ